MDNIIKIKDLSKSYTVNNKENIILKDVNVDIKKGSFLSILGKSGTGKSTLLRGIGGFEKIDNGEIIINNKKILKPGIDTSYVFQDFNQIFPWKTVYKNIEYVLEIKGLKKDEIKEKVNYFLELVKLDKYKDYYPHQLSGGMKQRVAIARALSLEQDVILMDEPFASLDADTRTSLQKELYKIWHNMASKLTIVLVTHSIIEAISLSTDFLVLDSNLTYKYFPNNVTGKDGIMHSPEDDGFDECWSKLNNLIRNGNNSDNN